MLVATVEVWPGGRVLERRVIGTLTLANVSNLAEVSEYEGYLDSCPVSIPHHRRADGAWSLVKKAIEDYEGAVQE
jgi:hypothetical protein